jgi:hypothetical protein
VCGEWHVARAGERADPRFMRAREHKCS